MWKVLHRSHVRPMFCIWEFNDPKKAVWFAHTLHHMVENSDTVLMDSAANIIDFRQDAYSATDVDAAWGEYLAFGFNDASLRYPGLYVSKEFNPHGADTLPFWTLSILATLEPQE